MSKWVIVGAKGMLGKAMLAQLDHIGAQGVEAIDIDDIDITDPFAVQRDLPDGDIYVNAAAYTAVDDAEDNEADAFAVNALGAANLARRAAQNKGSRFIQISTDYVFDGNRDSPYMPTHPVVPGSAYGRSKVAGEWAVRAYHPDALIVRTAWLYGDGNCFPRTIQRLLDERDVVSIVDDQVGQPTWTHDLADLIIRMMEAKVPAGVYHGTSSGQVSWCGFAQKIADSLGKPRDMIFATNSQNFVRPAPRPAYSVLSHDSLRAHGVESIDSWDHRWAVASKFVLDGESGAAEAAEADEHPNDD